MQRSDFIDEVFTFFRCTNEELKKAYDLAFSVRENIDWDKLYRLVINEAETRYLPTPKWFKDKFYMCIKQEGFNYHENNNTKVFVELLDGYTYEFELFNCTLPRAEIMRGLNRKFSRIETDEKGNSKRVSLVKNIRFIKEESDNEQISRSREVFA